MENKIYRSNIIIFFILDKNRIIKEFNQKALKLFGYKKEELLGKSVRILYDSKEKFLEIGKVYKKLEKNIIVKKEVKLKKKDGTLFWIELKGEKIDNDYMWYLRDIDEKKREEENIKKNEEELKKIKNDLKRLNKKKKEVISNLSHDLKTPLNAIVGFSDILIMEERNQNKIEKLVKIKNAGLKLSKMITNLINYILIEDRKQFKKKMIIKNNELGGIEIFIYEINRFNREIIMRLCELSDIKYKIMKEIKINNKESNKKYRIFLYSVNGNTISEIEEIKKIKNMPKIIIGNEKELEKFGNYFEAKLNMPINGDELKEKLFDLKNKKKSREKEEKYGEYKIDIGIKEKKAIEEILTELRGNCKIFNKRNTIEIGGKLVEFSQQLEKPSQEIIEAGKNYDTEKLKIIINNIEKSLKVKGGKNE